MDAVDRDRDSVAVWGSGSASREFLHVDDAADGIVLAAERYDAAEPVNLGAGRETSIRDLVGMIARLIGFDGKTLWDPTKPDGQPRRVLDVSRARRAFGFVASIELEDELAETVRWCRASAAERDQAGGGALIE